MRNNTQYTVDNSEKGVVSDSVQSNPMQNMVLKNDIAAIRAFKDARTSRIKSKGEANQKAFSVGGPASGEAMKRGNHYSADWL
jgi:hypothetical protein